MYLFVKKHATVFTLSAIFILAIGLRGYGIFTKGIFDYDEAWYLLEAKTLYNTLQFTLGKLGIIQDPDVALGLKAYIKQRGTVPLTSIKPGLTILYLLGFLAFGPYDYAGFLVSSLAGLGTIYLVYLIGRNAYGRHAGYFAALFLAISPFHILYSRSTYAQAACIFFITLAAYFWHRGHQKNQSALRHLVPTGLAVGWGFTCHFNLAWITVTFMILEAIALLKLRHRFPTWQSNLSRLGILGLAMATPALLFEIVGQTAKWFGIFPADYPTYLGQFAHREPLAKALQFSLEQIPFWTTRLYQIEGILIITIASIGLLCVLKRFAKLDLCDLLIVGLFLGVVVPPSILHSKGLYYILRNYAAALPALALFTALGTTFVIARIKPVWQKPAMALSATLFIANGILGSSDLLPLKSGYQEAVTALTHELETNNGHLATQPPSAWPIWYFYLSNAYETASPEVRKRIQFYPKGQKSDYELLDIKRYYRGLYAHEPKQLQAYTQLHQTHDPVITVPNSAAYLPRRYFEADGPQTSYTLDVLRNTYPQVAQIEIYDLRQSPTDLLSLKGISLEANHE